MHAAPNQQISSFVRLSGFRLKPWPILLTFGLGIVLLIPGGVVVSAISHYLSPTTTHEMSWVLLFVGHSVQLLMALGGIAVMKRFVPGHYGLRWPPGKTYLPAAVSWGLFFGVVMTLVDFGPQIAAHVAPEGPYSLTPTNICGWLSFEGIFVGFPEEILFRGLLVTYLTAKLPGRVGFFRYEMNAAGVVVAFMFALAHIGNFWGHPFWMALGQQIYAFALGALYAYWFEKSESLCASIVGHNISNLVEYALIFGMVALWR